MKKLDRKKLENLKGGTLSSAPGCGTIGILLIFSSVGYGGSTPFWNGMASSCWNN